MIISIMSGLLLLTSCLPGIPGPPVSGGVYGNQTRLTEPSRRFGELQARTGAAAEENPFSQEGLFYDPEHVALVRSNFDKPPWDAALARLEARAMRYLDFVPEPIHGYWEVPNFYKDRDGRDVAVKPLEDSTNAMMALSQQFLFSREEEFALKAVEIADAWTGSLMDIADGQAVYQAEWELMVMATAMGMVDGYGGWSPDRRAAFEGWLNERTWHLIGRDNSTNNHRYWLGAQAAAVGVLTEDGGMFQWAVEVYKEAVGHDIAPDGHMPQETARGERGIFYQNFAIEPLVLIAEIARRQGVDLWGYSFEGRDLKLAIEYLFGFLDSPEQWPWSDRGQDMSFMDPGKGGKKIAWFEMAYYHYRDSMFEKYLQVQRPMYSRRCGGMTTLTHGLP